ncbi:MAG: hypothetical protein AAF547_05730 [Actinomycetota bacterium]
MGRSSRSQQGGESFAEQQDALPDEIEREELLAQLDRRWHAALTTVIAPGGFGKSTLLGQMTRRRPSERLGVDVILRLGASDRDATVLARRILERLHVDVEPGDPDRAVGVVATAIAGLAPVQICIGLDDCHLLTDDSSATGLLRRLVVELPANAHLLLVGRDAPALPVARFRAADRVVEIGRAELAFSADEQVRLANTHGIDAASLAEIGGWPALTRLMIVAGHGAAADYLWEELVDSLERSERETMAILVMAGGAGPADLAELDVTLSATVLALPLVDRQANGTVRPHDLWWDVLDRLVDADRRQVLAGRVARWLLDHGRVEDALNLSLLVEDLDAACNVVLEALKDGTMARDALTIRRWHGLLPAATHHRPEVRLLEAVALRMERGRGHGEALVEEVMADFAERGAIRAETIAMAELIFRRWEQADMSGLIALYQRAKQLNADHDARLLTEFIAMVEIVFADISGDPVGALARLDGHWTHRSTDHPLAVLIHRWRSSLLLLLGRSEEAVATIEELVEDPVPSDAAINLVLALTRWQHGDPGPVLRYWSSPTGEGRAPNARDRFILQVYGRVVDASLGRPQPPIARRALARAGAGHGRDETFAAVAVAATLVANGDEPGAAALMVALLEERGPDDALALCELRRFLPLTAVLSPVLLDRFGQDDLGPQQQWRLALVRIFLDARAGRRTPWPATLTSPRILTALPLRWTIELALRAADGDHARGLELIDYCAEVVPERAVELLPEVASDIGLAETGARLLARIGRPPERPVRISVLGPLRVEMGGGPIGESALARTRVRQLLALLVLRPRVDRNRALDLLWPDLDRTSAQNNLRVTLTHVRQLLEPDRATDTAPYLLLAGRTDLQLRRCDHLTADLWDAERILDEARRHERAGRLAAAIDTYRRATDGWAGTPVLGDLGDVDELRPELVAMEWRLIDGTCRLGELLLASRLLLEERSYTRKRHSDTR